MNSDEMSFTTAAGGSPLAHFLKLVKSLDFTAEDLQKAGDYLTEEIRKRTLSGVDVGRAPFAAYSPKYQREKKQANVDLYGKYKHGVSTKHMLDALSAEVKINPGQISVGVIGDAELARRARIHNEGLYIKPAKRSSFKKLVDFFKRLRKSNKKRLANKGIEVIPQRNFLGITADDTKAMTAIIVNSIGERLGK